MDHEVLDLSPRIKGQSPKRLVAEVVGELTHDDLASLTESRSSVPPKVKRFRDSHHMLARAFASGMTPAQAGAQTGYSQSRISILSADPAFQDLVEVYRKTGDAQFAEYRDLAVDNMIRGERLISDSLEAAAESEVPLTPAELRPIADLVSDRADRFGYPKHAVGHSINHDLAGRLEAARRRSGLVADQSPPLIDNRPPEGEPVEDA